MAMFPTHIKCSTLAGIGCGTVAYLGYGVPLTTSLVGAGLCSVGGILPDIDSGPGIPLREITTFLASVVPTMLITRLLSYSFDQETLILAGAIIYVAIRFGLAHFLRHYTVHRGMFHSFPSMAIFGELTYLLFYGESMFVRLFMVAAVCLGFFIHLLLDEIYSVEWDGRPHLKRSFGTAMKFAGNEWWPNVACYAKLAVVTFFVLNDPNVIHQISAGQGQQVAKNLGQVAKDVLDSAVAKTGPKSSGDVAIPALIPRRPAGGTPGPTMVPANSTTVPPPAFAWPAASTTTSPTPAFAPQQPAAVAAMANGPLAADPPTSAGIPASGRRKSSAASAPSGTAQPADSRPWATPPSQPTSTGRFWQ
jgi:hypothetical protein